MLYGHIAVGLAAKRVAPKVSLGVLLLAATAIDVLAGVFMLATPASSDSSGASSMAWSHGLFMAAVWSIAGLGIAFLLSRDRRTGIVVGLLVFSHWVLDFISHPMGMGQELPPDLPLFFGGSPKVGLGLYNSVAAALITDFGLLIGGIVVYLVSTRAKDRTGKWALWLVIVFLLAATLLVLVPAAVVLATLALALLLPLGNWVDRHRSFVEPKSSATPAA